MYVEIKGGIRAQVRSSLSHSVSYKFKTKADIVIDRKAAKKGARAI